MSSDDRFPQDAAGYRSAPGRKWRFRLEEVTGTLFTRSCKPLVFCAKHLVHGNRRYGVSAIKNGKPYVPNICWFYLDRDGAWMGTVRAQGRLRGKTGVIVEDLLEGSGAFVRFPHYRTFLENTKPVPRSIQLKRIQVNAIRHLTAWTLKQSAAEISATLNIR